MTTNDIHIRDPFVFPHLEERSYYLFGTTDQNCWSGPGTGFDCYRSTDLANWEGPIPAFRPPPDFWGEKNYWAPEVYFFNGRFYMFASFKADRRYRGTQILYSEKISGPYLPLSDGPVTPPDWECLDGTLHIDSGGRPWIVFCQEWVQIHNGAIYAMRLSPDLLKPAARPVFLFNASEAPWVRRPKWPDEKSHYKFPSYITDGPFIYRTRSGTLLMLWSSSGAKGYAMGIARSESGDIAGPWRQMQKPLWKEDGGHNYLFFSEDEGQTWSQPAETPARGIVPDKLLELAGGRWLISCHERDGTTGNLAQHLWYSDDRGASWQGPVIVARQKGLNLCEASILPAGKALVAFMRENSGQGWDCQKAISWDSGETWGEVIPFPLPGCHRPVAGRLNDGRILITYRFMQGGKGWAGWWTQNFFAALTDLESALSATRVEAHTRILPIDFDRSPESDTGYSGWVQFDDGEIYIVNYIVDDAPRGQIRGYALKTSDFIIEEPKT